MERSNESVRETIRTRIISARKAKGWSPATAAKEIGAWEKTYRRWEDPNGSVPNIVWAARIATAFDVTLDWLAGRTMTKQQRALAMIDRVGEEADEVLRRVDRMMADLTSARAALVTDEVHLDVALGKQTAKKTRKAVAVTREAAG